MKDVQIRASASIEAWAHSWAHALKNRMDGATAAEYALLVSLIAVAIIGAVAVLGGRIRSVFQTTSSNLSTATN